jgi:hypothetical protein
VTIDEFFQILESLPNQWKWRGDAIRYHDTSSPSEYFTPLEIVCYFKGGTVSWRGGRLQKPSLLDMFYQHGKILGLSESDIHAIFRASDTVVRMSDGELALQIRSDFALRQRMIRSCGLYQRWTKVKQNRPQITHSHKMGAKEPWFYSTRSKNSP